MLLCYGHSTRSPQVGLSAWALPKSFCYLVLLYRGGLCDSLNLENGKGKSRQWKCQIWAVNMLYVGLIKCDKVSKTVRLWSIASNFLKKGKACSILKSWWNSHFIKLWKKSQRRWQCSWFLRWRSSLSSWYVKSLHVSELRQVWTVFHLKFHKCKELMSEVQRADLNCKYKQIPKLTTFCSLNLWWLNYI